VSDGARPLRQAYLPQSGTRTEQPPPTDAARTKGGASRRWQYRGNTRCSRCVRYVRGSALFGRFGRFCRHLASVYKVEGPVGRFPRGGSSPLERMSFRWKSLVSRPCAARASSERRTVATAWQQTVLLHAVDDHGVAGTANQSATAGRCATTRRRAAPDSGGVRSALRLELRDAGPRVRIPVRLRQQPKDRSCLSPSSSSPPTDSGKAS
jgi:hypothetical protein